VYRPLLHWSLEEVWAIHARYGLPRNPLYDLGFTRVGCAPCMMSRKEEIRRLARLKPERINLIRKAEVSIGNARGYSSFFQRDKVPLSQRTKSFAVGVMRVASIDDVVRWSSTARGGQQYLLDFDAETWDEPSSCAHNSGACE
jgi:3'-phosphoadenosine 5'-phosphosulfate sulfotransferase (PAPS reductase)/FAD synthetase